METQSRSFIASNWQPVRSVVQAVRDRLSEMGCSVEYMKSFNILAVSIPPQTKLAAVQSYLEAEMNAGKIDYEEPLLRQ